MTPGYLKALQYRIGPVGQRLFSLPMIDRYILGALWMPFLFGVGAFSCLGIAAGVLFDLVRNLSEARISLDIALQVLLLQMPYFISFALPMAVLLATLITFSRLSQDNELTALQGCGVSLYRLVGSALIFGLCVTGLTFTFNELLVPHSQYQAKALLKQTLTQEQSNFQDQNIFYQEYGRDREVKRLFYARRFDGEKMNGLTMLDFSQAGVSQVVTADAALWEPETSTWTFYNGTIYVVTADGSYQNLLQFGEQQLRIPRSALENTIPERKVDEMNLVEASNYLKLIRQTGDRKQIRKLEIRIQQKWALPFVAVGFALIGTALSVSVRRNQINLGFGVSILIILGHYILSFLADALGNQGLVSPFLAAWFPTFLGVAIGGGLVIRAAR